MSIDIHGGRFWQGRAAGIPVDALQRAFAALIVSVEPGAFMLRLQGAGGAETALILKTQQAFTESFSVARPVEDARLYQALLEIAGLEGVVLYAPGSPPVVAHAATAAHLPAGMIEALGPAHCVSGADPLRMALFGR